MTYAEQLAEITIRHACEIHSHTAELDAKFEQMREEFETQIAEASREVFLADTNYYAQMTTFIRVDILKRKLK